MVGPIGTAGSQFLLSLLLLRMMDPGEFGRFSFLMILTQLSWGISSALFGAPLSSLLSQGTAEERDAIDRQLFSASLIGAALCALLFIGICLALGTSVGTALLFAAYAGLALQRWFGRAHAYLAGQQLAVTRSDIVYSLAILAAPLAIVALPFNPLFTTSAMLLIAIILSIAALRPRELLARIGGVSFAHAWGYRAVWHSHGRWALFGVMTTEATANGHAYLVALIAGPAQFAPVAASALLIRPLTIGLNALSEYERPRLAHIIAAGDIGKVDRAILTFRLLLAAIWVGTAILAAGLMIFAPRLIFPPAYDTRFLAIGGILWLIVGIARLLRMPDSVLLQAAGRFRSLAMASLFSAIASLVAVTLLVLAYGPLWSILGILLGEMLFALSTWRRARAWAQERTDRQCPA